MDNEEIKRRYPLMSAEQVGAVQQIMADATALQARVDALAPLPRMLAQNQLTNVIHLLTDAVARLPPPGAEGVAP